MTRGTTSEPCCRLLLLCAYLPDLALCRSQGSIPPRLFPVGRLDVQSIGLIFITNDGDWAHK